jgi:hypothetical protein
MSYLVCFCFFVACLLLVAGFCGSAFLALDAPFVFFAACAVGA